MCRHFFFYQQPCESARQQWKNWMKKSLSGREGEKGGGREGAGGKEGGRERERGGREGATEGREGGRERGKRESVVLETSLQMQISGPVISTAVVWVFLILVHVVMKLLWSLDQ